MSPELLPRRLLVGDLREPAAASGGEIVPVDIPLVPRGRCTVHWGAGRDSRLSVHVVER
ncbi:hypothetical protein [Gordonia insulae]|uniref:hypothetical protein n=1 Tax=Gordonia insulae TaxID=2420509 RepID=UPI0013DDF5A3|nr:hypothetical protein [Gordonia insulae]